jgi:hypothetical protein
VKRSQARLSEGQILSESLLFWPLCIILSLSASFKVGKERKILASETDQCFIGQYLSCRRKLDCVILFKAGFQTQLRASPLSISGGMSTLGMARQICDGRLQGGIQPDHVATLQGLDEGT